MSWQNVELGDVVTLQRGYDLTERERRVGTVPVVSSSGISGYHDETKIKGPGVVTGRYGTLGQVYYINEDFWPHNTTLFVKDFHGNDVRFAYYLLSSLELGSQSAVSAVPGVNRNTLHRLPVKLPPLPIQRRIAAILGRLDDKIEVNRRINRTLEAMAQALYQHWFVDFGPFQAGEFVESALGLIPVGWQVGKMEDLFWLQRGFDLPAQDRIPGQIPIMAASGLNGFHSEYKVEGPGIVTGRSGVIGQVFYVTENFWPLNTSLWIREFRASTPLYAYHFLKNFDLAAFNTGSAVPTLNRNDVHGVPTLVPNRDVIELFEEQVCKWFAMINKNELQNQKLAEIRDYLLPKLLSGEIGVAAAEFS